MIITRAPRASLRPFVRQVWSLAETSSPAGERATREHVLPTGGMHLVFRLNEVPLVIHDGTHGEPRTVSCAVVGGARSAFYSRDASAPPRSVGAMLQPGAARLLFGAHAGELAEAHTPLDLLWGAAAGTSLEMLSEARTPVEQLEVFEAILSSRLPVVHGMHPAVAFALERLGSTDRVDTIVRQTGYSHRHFIALFRHAVGLAPKTYARVLRFRRALQETNRSSAAPLARVALDAGYSDQAHFIRDFVAFTGMTPAAYRRIGPDQPSHVRVDSRGRAGGIR
jgi:AraC-like DNA-binding protein